MRCLNRALQFVPVFVLVVFRLAGMMLFAPLFGSARIPRRVKGLLVLILALGMTRGVTPPVSLPSTPWGLALGIAGEMAFGLAMGMVMSFVFIAAQWAGEIIGQQMGLNISEVIDPQFGAQNSLVGDFYFMLTLVVFLLVGGHRAMLQGVRASFDLLPLLSLGMDRPLLDLLTGLFQGGDRPGRPAGGADARDHAGGGPGDRVIGKTVPQMNVMALGLSLRSVVGMLVVIVSLTLTVGVMRESVEQSMVDVWKGWTTPPVAPRRGAYARRVNDGRRLRRQNRSPHAPPARGGAASRATSPAAPTSPPPRCCIAAMLLLNSFGPQLVAALRALVADMLSPASLANVDADSALRRLAQVRLHHGRRPGAAAGRGRPGGAGGQRRPGGLQPQSRPAPAEPRRAQPASRASGRIFGGGRGAVRLLLDALKFLLLGAVGYSAVHGRLAQIVTVQQLSFIQIFFLGASIVYSIGLRIGITLLVLAIIDYAYQRWRIEQELKMTKQEVKEEMRRMEGDPEDQAAPPADRPADRADSG